MLEGDRDGRNAVRTFQPVVSFCWMFIRSWVVRNIPRCGK